MKTHKMKDGKKYKGATHKEHSRENERMKSASKICGYGNMKKRTGKEKDRIINRLSTQKEINPYSK